MGDSKRHPGDRRESILRAACHLFAEHGYRGATVAQICRAARANIAAVNYYFGGKENLYQQAWRFAHDQLLAQAPFAGGVPADRPAGERLRGIVHAALQRALMDDAPAFRIMHKEMAEPTGLLRQVVKDAIGPIRTATQEILRELLGPEAGDVNVEWCEVCVVAPMMHVMHRRQARKHEGLAPVFREEDLEAMTDHFTAFALAGIRESRRRIRKTGGAMVRSRGNSRRGKKA